MWARLADFIIANSNINLIWTVSLPRLVSDRKHESFTKMPIISSYTERRVVKHSSRCGDVYILDVFNNE